MNPATYRLLLLLTVRSILSRFHAPQIIFGDPYSFDHLGGSLKIDIIIGIVAVRTYAEFYAFGVQEANIIHIVAFESFGVIGTEQVGAYIDLYDSVVLTGSSGELIVHGLGNLPSKIIQPRVGWKRAIVGPPPAHPPPRMSNNCNQRVCCQEHILAVIIADHNVTVLWHIYWPMGSSYNVLDSILFNIFGRDADGEFGVGWSVRTQAIDWILVLAFGDFIDFPA